MELAVPMGNAKVRATEVIVLIELEPSKPSMCLQLTLTVGPEGRVDYAVTLSG